MSAPTDTTSLTLLGRLRDSPADEAAWSEFVARYGPHVAAWCRQWGLQEADAQDVAQDVLLALVKQMGSFVYRQGGKFRAWLKTVAYRTWCDLLERRGRPGGGSGDSAVLQLLHSVPAREDFLARLDEAHSRELLGLAMTAVRRRVQPQTWEAFRLLTLERLPGARVAELLGMKPGTVFVASCRVEKLLREELGRLED